MLPFKSLAARSLTAVLLTTTAVAVVAMTAEVATQRRAAAALAKLQERCPGLVVASIDASVLRRRADLRGVHLKVGAVEITIGSLHLPFAPVLPHLVNSAMASPFDDEPAKPSPEAPAEPAAPAQATPAPAAPAAPTAAVGKASADNVTITSGATTYRIKHVELAGTSLTSADVAAILDPKSATPVADRLKTVSAASIVIPEIAADSVKADSEVHWTERDILLADVVAGRVANGSAAGMSIASKTAKDVLNGTIGAVQVTGLDLTQIVRVFTTQRTDDSEPLVPLADRLSIDGAHISDLTQKTETSIGPIHESGFTGRPLKVSIDATSSSDPEASKAATRDIFQSFKLAAMDAGDLKVTTEEGRGTLVLSSLSMQDWGGGKVGGAKVSGIAFNNPDTTFAIGAIEIKGLDIPLGGKPTSKDAKDVEMPTLGHTDVTDVSFDTLAKGSKPTDAPTRVKFSLKHVGFASDPAAENAPRQGTMSFDQLVFDLPPDSGAAPLVEMGYARVNLSGGLQTTYDKSAQTATIKGLTLSGESMGAIHLDLDLANVSPALFSQDKNASKVAALAVLLRGVDLAIENAGLVDKALAWRAKADNLTPQQEQTQIAEVAATQIPAALGNSAAGKTIAAAVAKFIAQPKSLHISAHSKTGIGLADAALLSTPDVLLDTLDIQASAND